MKIDEPLSPWFQFWRLFLIGTSVCEVALFFASVGRDAWVLAGVSGPFHSEDVRAGVLITTKTLGAFHVGSDEYCDALNRCSEADHSLFGARAALLVITGMFGVANLLAEISKLCVSPYRTAFYQKMSAMALAPRVAFSLSSSVMLLLWVPAAMNAWQYRGVSVTPKPGPSYWMQCAANLLSTLSLLFSIGTIRMKPTRALRIHPGADHEDAHHADLHKAPAAPASPPASPPLGPAAAPGGGVPPQIG
eukprot:tig00000093_g3566.t1